MKLLSLKCPSCGSNLEIAPEMESFACGYCGSQQIVERRGGTVSLKLVTDAIGRVQSGTDKTAAELALKRMAEELDALRKAYKARVLQTERQRSSVVNSTIGVVLVGGSIMSCVLVKEIGGLGLILMVLAGVAGYFYIRKTVQPINEAHDHDCADMRNRIAELKWRIAEKRAIADS